MTRVKMTPAATSMTHQISASARADGLAGSRADRGQVHPPSSSAIPAPAPALA